MAIGTMDELRNRMKYGYSVKILDKNADILPRKGQSIRGLDGTTQIITTEQEANRISRLLIRKGTKFSMSPVSLEEIFYYIVKKTINVDEEGV